MSPWLALALVAAIAAPGPGERLDRGAVAIPGPEGTWVGWRRQASDPVDLAFNVYRSGPSGWELMTPKPTTAPGLLDAAPGPGRYAVRAVVQGRRGPLAEAMAGSPGGYLSIPLRPLPGYTANDGSVGDLDGDGAYELVVHRTGRARDNSQAGPTDPPILEAYRLDGRFLWRIDLGRNIREGAHYTQFLVFDFDGDGRAEVACKTADGTVDGTGKTIGRAGADHRNPEGYVLRGPEFLTVFDGKTGRARSTVPYLPPRHPSKADPTPEELKAVWGDGYGNRSDRFLAGVAYLDGANPSLVFARGYYTRTVVAAWDFAGGRLRKRWLFDSDDGHRDYAGQGNHSLTVADVDEDGRDEIVYGSMTLEDDGAGLYTTRLGHGDALHVSDLDPSRPGLEVFAIHEKPASRVAASFRDAKTGEVVWSQTAADAGRGLAADIDPRRRGAESWAGLSEPPPALWDAQGRAISDRRPKSCNFAVWWDGDPLREILDGTTITKWSPRTESEDVLLEAEGCASNNGTKATPVLCADILGDWREEVVWRSADDQELRIYSSPIPTRHRLPTLMADRQYRLSVASQNVGYNQPTNPSFDMATHARSIDSELPTLWLIGDSTVRNGGGQGGGGMWGWGDRIAAHFDPARIRVVNRAIGGRSSRTFLTDRRWDAILAESKPGDFVILQFGHNDGGALNDDSRARGTLRGIGDEMEEIDNLLTHRRERVYTFGWYLRLYVQEARGVGMVPIVASYVPRCPRPGEPVGPTPEPSSYRLWAQQVAEAERAGYIDLYDLVWSAYRGMTPEQIRASDFTEADFTHTSLAGAERNAACVVKGIRALGSDGLARFLRDP